MLIKLNLTELKKVLNVYATPSLIAPFPAAGKFICPEPGMREKKKKAFTPFGFAAKPTVKLIYLPYGTKMVDRK